YFNREIHISIIDQESDQFASVIRINNTSSYVNRMFGCKAVAWSNVTISSSWNCGCNSQWHFRTRVRSNVLIGYSIEIITNSICTSMSRKLNSGVQKFDM